MSFRVVASEATTARQDIPPPPYTLLPDDDAPPPPYSRVQPTNDIPAMQFLPLLPSLPMADDPEIADLDPALFPVPVVVESPAPDIPNIPIDPATLEKLCYLLAALQSGEYEIVKVQKAVNVEQMSIEGSSIVEPCRPEGFWDGVGYDFWKFWWRTLENRVKAGTYTACLLIFGILFILGGTGNLSSTKAEGWATNYVGCSISEIAQVLWITLAYFATLYNCGKLASWLRGTAPIVRVIGGSLLYFPFTTFELQHER